MKPAELFIGQHVRVRVGYGYPRGLGIVQELPGAPDPNRPLPETAFALVRFFGEIPPTWRCDPKALERAL